MNLLAELQAVLFHSNFVNCTKSISELSLVLVMVVVLLYSAFKNEPTVIKNLTRAKTPRSCVSFRGLKSAYLPAGALLCS